MNLHDLLVKAIRDAASNNKYCSITPGPVVAGVYADAVIDVLIDLAGTGQLLKAIDGMHRV